MKNSTFNLSKGEYIPTRTAKKNPSLNELPDHDCFVAALVRSFEIIQETDGKQTIENECELVTGYYIKKEKTFYLNIDHDIWSFKNCVFSMKDNDRKERFYWLGHVSQWIEIDELSATGKMKQELKL